MRRAYDAHISGQVRFAQAADPWVIRRPRVCLPGAAGRGAPAPRLVASHLESFVASWLYWCGLCPFSLPPYVLKYVGRVCPREDSIVARNYLGSVGIRCPGIASTHCRTHGASVGSPGRGGGKKSYRQPGRRASGVALATMTRLQSGGLQLLLISQHENAAHSYRSGLPPASHGMHV